MLPRTVDELGKWYIFVSVVSCKDLNLKHPEQESEKPFIC